MNESIYIKFGKMISKMRINIGLSQDEVASRLDLPKSTYGNYERGERKVPLTELIAMSKFYGFSIDDFVNEVKKELPEDNPLEIKRKYWDKEFGYIDWTPEEIEELKSYARYLLLKRESEK